MCFLYRSLIRGENMHPIYGRGASHEDGATSVHDVSYVYRFTIKVVALWKEKVGDEAPRREVLVVQVVPPQMDKEGATACPEALVGAQGKVISADSIQGV
jgi:hypothetical protein